jgi:hypothetical protein
MWVSLDRLLAEVPQVMHQVLKTLRIVRETIMRKNDNAGCYRDARFSVVIQLQP